MEKKTADLHDGFVDSLIDFAEGKPMLLRDSQVKGLQLRLGKVRHQWQFYNERSDHGKRIYTCVPLGHYDRGGRSTAVIGGRDKGPVVTRFGEYIGPQPTLQRAEDHVDVAAARDKARVKAANAITGTLPVGKRDSVKLGEAFEDYLTYLEALAAKRRKPPRWAKNVRYLGNQIILPMWKNWTLAEMSERPDAVADWHAEQTKIVGATSANHAVRIVRALYRRRAKRDLRLSKVNLPTAAVDFASERREKKGMAPATFPAWFAAWQELRPIRRSFHLTCLLTGARPGELARTKWGDLNDNNETLTIGGGNLKAGNTVPSPLTPEIKKAIAIVGERGDDDALIWEGCSQASRDDLPATGNDLRRTYKTIATGTCGVPDDVSAFLMGHVPEGMSQKYLLSWALSSSDAIKEAQAKISATMMRLLHGASAKKRAA
jgi:integrase